MERIRQVMELLVAEELQFARTECKLESEVVNARNRAFGAVSLAMSLSPDIETSVEIGEWWNWEMRPKFTEIINKF